MELLIYIVLIKEYYADLDVLAVAIHLTASHAGAFHSTAQMLPRLADGHPLTLAQSDDGLHLPGVEIIGVEHPQELGGTQKFVDAVPVVVVVLLGRRVLQQVFKVEP